MAKKIKYPVFVFTLFIGLGLIAIAILELDVVFDGQTLGITGLSILTVPLDPTTDAIFGTVVLGAPDVVSSEFAATLIGLPRTSGTYPLSPCSDNLSGFSPPFQFDAPDFKIRLSGDPNQVNPEWWGSRDTGIVDSRDCAFAYFVWDISDLPDSFIASQITFQFELLETRGIRNTNNPPQSCKMSFLGVEQVGFNFVNRVDITTISDQEIMNIIYEPHPTAPTSTGRVIASFNCDGSPRVISFNAPVLVGFFNNAIVTNDKLTLGFAPLRLDNLGTGKNKLSTDYWKTEGSWLVTGTSSAINCGVGFTQVDFKCVPITCSEGFAVNSTNQCSPIICASDEILIGDICTPVVCNVGEQIVTGICTPIQCNSSDALVGSECIPLICDSGFEAVNNACAVKQCSIGMELVGDNCQTISCQANTVLVGNNCIERTCPSGQISVNNICTSSLEFDFVTVDDPSLCPADTVDVQFVEATGKYDCLIKRSLIFDCGVGTHQVGDSCIADDLNCPEGSVEFENVCVQRIPSLLSLSDEGFLTPDNFLIAGAIITVMSVAGIIIRRI